MLCDELLKKLKGLDDVIRSAEGDDLPKAKAEFDELHAEMVRLEAIAEQEAAAVSRAEVADRSLWDVFGKLMRGEAVDDVARDALCIRDASLRDRAGQGAFRLPGRAIDWMDVSRVALGSVSTDISDIIPPTPLAPLFSLPLPPTPFFDGSTKLPALNGIAIPFLVQTAADPFAGVSVTVPVGEGEDKPESGIPTLGQKPITTQEYAGSTIISDLALRRAPNYEGAISSILRGALATQINDDIITALLADATVVVVPRSVANAVDWADLINLEGAVPHFWNVNGKYALHQDCNTYLKSTLASTPIGYPLYTSTTEKGMYTHLNGRGFFLDRMSALGVEGDVVYGDPRNVFLGVGQDIVFKRTSEGLALTQANSTLFVIFAHIGIGIPVGATFSRLDNEIATITTTGA